MNENSHSFISNKEKDCVSKPCNSVIPDLSAALLDIRQDRIPNKSVDKDQKKQQGLLNQFRATYFSKSGKIIGYSKPENQTGFPFALNFEKEFSVVLHTSVDEKEPHKLFLVSIEAILEICITTPENELLTLFRAMALKTLYVHNLKKTLGAFIDKTDPIILPRRIIDTYSYATVLHYSEPHGAVPDELPKLLSDHIRPRFIPEHLLAQYSKPVDISIHQAMSLPYLYRELSSQMRLRFGTPEAGEIESSFQPELIKIESAGVPVDASALKPLITPIEKNKEEIKSQIKVGVFNPKRANLKRKLSKVANELSFLRDFTDTDAGRVRGTFNSYCCPSGRISTSKPNLQGILRKYKEITYKAPEGRVILSGDIPSSQVRIASIIGNDMELIQCIKEGKDLHRLTASKIFNKEENEVNDEERQIGKTANFQLLFGTGAEHFRDELEKKTGKKHNLRDVKKIIKAFKKGYPEIANWQEEIAAMFNDDPDGKGVPYPYVTTLSGKQIYVEEYNKALNYAIAGTEAEIIKKAVVSFGEEIRDRALDAQVINLVHDNVVVECSIEDKEESSKLLKEALETSFNLTLKQFLTTVEIKTLSETPMNNENSSNGGINEKE